MKKYEKEFKQMLVDLYQQGQRVAALEKEFGINSSTIYKWVGLYGQDAKTGLSTDDIKQMRREMAKLKEQNEILKKAIVIFTNK